jgi:hypothetical protein
VDYVIARRDPAISRVAFLVPLGKEGPLSGSRAVNSLLFITFAQSLRLAHEIRPFAREQPMPSFLENDFLSRN